MKESKFNTFFPHENAIVGYNAFSNEFIALDSTLYEMYDVARRIKDFTELKELHYDFYNFLVEKGFLVENNIDEFEKVKNESYKIDNDSSTFELIVNPTMNCNFKCWYCYETHIKDSKMDADTISATIKFASNVIQNQKGLKHFALSFFGGEPLLYFDKVIKPLISSIYKKCNENSIFFSCGMTTNGLLINSKMLEFCQTYGLTSFQITLDGNRDYHDRVRYISEGRGSFDKIIQNIILSVKHGIHITVRINCSIETMQNIGDILLEFNQLTNSEKKMLYFDIHRVWQEDDEKIGDLIYDACIHFSNQGFIVRGVDANTQDAVLSSCYADKRYQATINYNGEVFKCTARDFTNNTGEGLLNRNGELIWNDKYEKRMNIKFKNPPCKECRILPICAGGCSQHALEHEGKEYCIKGFDENAKTQTVIKKFKALL